MKKPLALILCALGAALVVCSASSATAAPSAVTAVDPNFHLYLLMGQSNMEGMAGAEAQDKTTNPRIKVLAYTNCANTGRVYDQWYTAAPPLHGCGAGVGPGDYFAKAMADSFPKITIGLIPTAIAGVDIDYFRKGVVSKRRNEFSIPPDNKRPGAYDMVIEKAKEAQKVGVIRGILFHQGESDAGDEAWVGKVKGMVADLRKDLALGDSVPFLAGEMLYGGCCEKHNPIINKLPAAIPDAYVISAKDLPGQDQAHFNVVGQRALGRRFATKMSALLRSRQTTGIYDGESAPGGPKGNLEGTSTGSGRILVRRAASGNGMLATCTGVCDGFALSGLDGKTVGRAAGASWMIPEGRFPRGLYFLRASGSKGSIGSNESTGTMRQMPGIRLFLGL
jgi:hypothetical protein